VSLGLYMSTKCLRDGLPVKMLQSNPMVPHSPGQLVPCWKWCGHDALGQSVQSLLKSLGNSYDSLMLFDVPPAAQSAILWQCQRQGWDGVWQASWSFAQLLFRSYIFNCFLSDGWKQTAHKVKRQTRSMYQSMTAF
jgi:hypothetical protein